MVCACVVSVAFGQAWAFDHFSKMDPRLTKILLNSERIDDIKNDLSLKKSGTQWFVEAIITFDGNVYELESSGVQIVKSFADMAVVRVPFEKLEQVAENPQIIYMEAPTISKPYLDKSIPVINGIKARQTLNKTGKGVLVGVIDSGIDWQHYDFRKSNGDTRIKFLLDLSDSNGNYYGGKLYTEQDINNALNGLGQVNEYDYSGHGTHVAGIIAGDDSELAGYGSFAGVAPEADLVIVKASRDVKGDSFLSTDQFIALTFIDSVASVLGMPYVVNMSLGGHFGAHDGTASTEREIDALVGPTTSGKAIVTVAGNERDVNIHAKAYLGSSSGSSEITFNVDGSGSGNDLIQLDAWYDGSSNVTLSLISPDGVTHGPVRRGNYYDKSTNDGKILILNGYFVKDNGSAVYGVSPFNGDFEIYIEISDNDGIAPSEGEWKIKFEGSNATIDAYMAYSSINVQFDQGSVSTGKISVPGTSKNVITSGGYITRLTWTDFENNTLTIDSQNNMSVGDIADFSNPGPTRDGRIKPDVTAPAMMIASTISQQAWVTEPNSMFISGNSSFPYGMILQDGKHGLASGTSMAGPHVAGAVALLLEEFPNATATQLQGMLANSANADQYTGSLPNSDWGWGKLDVYKALQTEPGEKPVLEFIVDNIYPNPFPRTETKSAHIDYMLSESESGEHITITVYNALGQKVRTIISETQNAGSHAVIWDGRDDNSYPVAAGVYLVEFKSNSKQEVKKVVYLGNTN